MEGGREGEKLSFSEKERKREGAERVGTAEQRSGWDKRERVRETDGEGKEEIKHEKQKWREIGRGAGGESAREIEREWARCTGRHGQRAPSCPLTSASHWHFYLKDWIQESVCMCVREKEKECVCAYSVFQTCTELRRFSWTYPEGLYMRNQMSESVDPDISHNFPSPCPWAYVRLCAD